MSAPPIRALIVDDEPAARKAIRGLLAGDPDIRVDGECPDGRSALAAIRDGAPDLLFLDIQMPELDGFEMLRRVEPARLPVVVFVTAYDQYALQAFEAHALDYVLKPFDDERFRQAVVRAKDQVRQRRLGALGEQLVAMLHGASAAPPGPAGGWLQRLPIKADGRIAIVELDTVDWLESDGDYVRIHAGGKRHLLRETMKHLEARLDPARFVRIHRSTIVNVARIRELQPYFRGEYVVLLRDGARLKLSRGCRPRLEAVLGRSL